MTHNINRDNMATREEVIAIMNALDWGEMTPEETSRLLAEAVQVIYRAVLFRDRIRAAIGLLQDGVDNAF